MGLRAHPVTDGRITLTYQMPGQGPGSPVRVQKQLTFHHDSYVVDVAITTEGIPGTLAAGLGTNFGIVEWSEGLIGLIGYLRGGYDGIDIHSEAVAWCQRAITSRHPTFRFHRADLASRAYNPQGRVPASAYRFPFPDHSFDVIFLGSVFTHMLPDDVESYVREIGRLLAPGGMCVASYFLLNDETRDGVNAGRSFLSFAVPHPSGLCRLHDVTKPEAAVALEETFVRRVHAEAQLRIRVVRRGGWWDGKRDEQELLTGVA